jgi:hypothetical protein
MVKRIEVWACPRCDYWREIAPWERSWPTIRHSLTHVCVKASYDLREVRVCSDD